MNRVAVPAAIVSLAVWAELILPGRALYHAGWYNVLLGALIVATLAGSRPALQVARGARARAALVAVVAGTLAAGTAGVANGLFAPDNREVVGAPGQRVAVEGTGTLVFPLADANATPSVSLERPPRPPLAIGSRGREAGDAVLRAREREVVYVEARDPRGNRLTITQPQGPAFLSPVLLMQHRQSIAGIDLPYDSFDVPAERRVVKTLLFSPAQAAVMLHGAAPGTPAVLFAVDDDAGRLVPHGIALSAQGAAVRAGGLLLRAFVRPYPSVEVISAPNVVAVLAGALLVWGGIVALYAPLGRLAAGHDRAHVAQHDASVG